MANDKDKYESVIMFLKNKKPDMGDSGILADDVLREIREREKKPDTLYTVYEFLFGWTNIEWVRRSLVFASVLLVLFIGYQQSVIMKRMSTLSVQTFRNGNTEAADYSDDVTARLTVFRIFGGKVQSEGLKVSEKDIDGLVNSLDELREKYKDLYKVIENDPQLRKYIEERLKEKQKPKM